MKVPGNNASKQGLHIGDHSDDVKNMCHNIIASLVRACAMDNTTAVPVTADQRSALDVLADRNYVKVSQQGAHLTPLTRSLLVVLIPVDRPFLVYDLRRAVPLTECTSWDMMLRLADDGWKMADVGKRSTHAQEAPLHIPAKGYQSSEGGG